MSIRAARSLAIAFLDRPIVRFGFLPATVGLALLLWLAVHGSETLGFDVKVYWDAAALSDPYGPLLDGAFDGYKYPPPLAQALAPFRAIPWPVFWGAWMLLLLAAYAFLAGRWALPLLFVYPLVFGEFWLGNINLFVAVAILVGFRWPAAWSAVLLTKITPGVGLLWFALRREWRSLGIALGATTAVAAVSFALAPDLWRDFVAVARGQLAVAQGGHALEIPVVLPVRILVAIVVVGFGARTDRRWTVPVAAAIAAPFAWWGFLAVAVAAIPLASPASAPAAARLAGPAREAAAG